MTLEHYPSLRRLFNAKVPQYKSASFPNFLVSFGWDPTVADKMAQISEKRSTKRIASYVSDDELKRAGALLALKGEASIRFGVKKEGHGIKGARGDFCLIGGAVKKTSLVLCYRSLELIGGLHYDTCIIEYVESFLDLNFKTITIFCPRAHVLALRGNSNEALYAKLRAYYG